MPKLRIEEKVTVVRYVPIDRDHYPAADEGQGAMTPQEALEYEKDRDVDDKIEHFYEGDVDFAPPLGDSQEVPTGDYSCRIEIVK